MNFFSVPHSKFFIKQFLLTIESSKQNVEDPFDGFSLSGFTRST